MRRTGIDLSSTRCILADVETPAVERRKGERRGFRVHRFVSLPTAGDSQAPAAELKALMERKEFPRRAWINLWDVRSSHQYLLLPSAAADELESKARTHAASILGMNDADVTVGTIIGSTRAEAGHHPKTEVSFFAAGTQEIRQRLRPFVDAGFHDRRRHHAMWRALVASQTAKAVSAWRGSRTCRARPCAIGARNLQQRRSPLCARHQLGLRRACDRCGCLRSPESRPQTVNSSYATRFCI